MKKPMGLLASTLLAAGLGIGGPAMVAGPAAAETGLQSVTVPAATPQTNTYYHDDHRCHWNDRHGRYGNWHWDWCHDRHHGRY
jgi:hypothetical protein